MEKIAGTITLPKLFSIFLGAFALLWAPSFYLNDEITQVAGLRALSNGHLELVNDFPPEYLALKEQEVWHWALRATENGPAPPVGSTLLNILALPVLLLLWIPAQLIGVHAALALAGSVAVAFGLRHAIPLVSTSLHASRWAIGLATVGFLPALWSRELPAEPFLQLGAIQFVSMAASAVGAVFLFDLVRSRFGIPVAILSAVAFSFATPAFFWANTAKYHALSLCLVLLALWCYQEGHRTGPIRTALAFALAGLSVWNNRLGVFLLLTVGIIALPVVRLGWRPTVQRATAGALGLAVGLFPLLVERSMLATFDTVAPEGLSYSAASHLEGTWQAALQGIVWTDYLSVQGTTLSLLSISGFLVLGFLAWMRPFKPNPLPSNLLVAGPIYSIALFAIAGGYLLNFGAGYDVRHILTLYPFLLVAAVPFAAGAVERQGRARLVQWCGGILGVFVPVYLVFQLLYHRAIGTFTQLGREFDVLAFNRYGGPLLAFLLLVAIGLAWKGPSRLRPKALLAFDAILVASVTLALFLQVLLQLLRWERTVAAARAPFVFWWADLLSQGIAWMVYSLR